MKISRKEQLKNELKSIILSWGYWSNSVNFWNDQIQKEIGCDKWLIIHDEARGEIRNNKNKEI
jgi:hypothetical protein